MIKGLPYSVQSNHIVQEWLMLNTIHVDFPIVQGYIWSDKIRKFNYFHVDSLFCRLLFDFFHNLSMQPLSYPPIFTTFSVLAELDAVCVSFPHPDPRNPMAATAAIPNTPVTQFFLIDTLPVLKIFLYQ